MPNTSPPLVSIADNSFLRVLLPEEAFGDGANLIGPGDTVTVDDAFSVDDHGILTVLDSSATQLTWFYTDSADGSVSSTVVTPVSLLNTNSGGGSSINIKLKTPASGGTVSGLNNTTNYIHEFVIYRGVIPNSQTLNSVIDNTILRNATDSIKSGFFDHDTPLAPPQVGCTLALNGVAVTDSTVMRSLVEDDVVRVTQTVSLSDGTLTLFSGANRTVQWFCDIKQYRIIDPADGTTILHNFDMANLDLATGAVTDSVGSASLTLTGYSVEGVGIESSTGDQLGRPVDLAVDSAFKYSAMNVGGTIFDSFQRVDQHTARAVPPVDGLPLGVASTVTLTPNATEYPQTEALFDGGDTVGDYWSMADLAYLYNDSSGNRQPIALTENVSGIEGRRGNMNLMPPSNQIAQYYDGELRHDANQVVIYNASPQIDPNVSGVTFMMGFRFTIDEDSGQPDLWLSQPVSGQYHGPIQLIVDTARSAVTVGLSSDPADIFEIDVDMNDGHPYLLGVSVDTSGNAIITVDGVEERTHAIQGALELINDYGITVGNRTGLTNYGFNFKLIAPKAFTTAEMLQVATEWMANLSIGGTPYASLVKPAGPTVTVQPVSATLDEGNSFAPTVDGTGYDEIEWYRSTTGLLDGAEAIPGSNNTTMPAQTAAEADNGRTYWAILKNTTTGVWVASDKATLTVNVSVNFLADVVDPLSASSAEIFDFTGNDSTMLNDSSGAIADGERVSSMAGYKGNALQLPNSGGFSGTGVFWSADGYVGNSSDVGLVFFDLATDINGMAGSSTVFATIAIRGDMSSYQFMTRPNGASPFAGNSVFRIFEPREIYTQFTGNDASVVVNADEWVRLIRTFDSTSNTIKVWINGVEVVNEAVTTDGQIQNFRGLQLRLGLHGSEMVCAKKGFTTTALNNDQLAACDAYLQTNLGAL